MGCVFFFQAEDGIRDADVTGVQTCALPILNVLQPETSLINTIPSKNLTHDDIVQHQLQQSKVQYFPDSYDTVKPSNDAMFNIFQHHINQNIPQSNNPVVSNSPSGTLPNATQRDPTY